MKAKVVLTEEKETLLIPLYGKARIQKQYPELLKDPKAAEILAGVEYNFSLLRVPAKTGIMMALRARLIDNYTRHFLEVHPNAVVLHLGCGLDSRVLRVNAPDADWYDLDYGEVMQLRRVFYSETSRYHMIHSSVTDLSWMDQVPVSSTEVLIIAEGLFMYLTASELQNLLHALKARFGGFTLIFDAFNSFTVRKISRHPSIRKTGARIFWGMDDDRELECWLPGMQLQQMIPFTKNEAVKFLPALYRTAFAMANLFPMARNAQRILVYTCNNLTTGS